MTAYTPRGYPYPNDYQQPADTPAALSDLASAVDSDVASVQATAQAALPKANIQTGAVVVSVVGSQNGTEAITFGPFPANPRVVATAQNVVYNCSVTGLTASGCNINVRHVDGTAQTADVAVHWVAIYGEG